MPNAEQSACGRWLRLSNGRVVLSTFKVNTTLDTVAVNLKTGKDASGHISLRSAIMAANARPNADTIILPGGTYQLTIAGGSEDKAATGDLDINGKLTLKGKKAASTIVDGGSLDRVFQILAGTVKISGITIEHGTANEGAGLLNTGGNVFLTSVVVQDNLATGQIGAAGTDASGGGANGIKGGDGGIGADATGGGIFNAAGSMTITNSVINSNECGVATAGPVATVAPRSARMGPPGSAASRRSAVQVVKAARAAPDSVAESRTHRVHG